MRYDFNLFPFSPDPWPRLWLHVFAQVKNKLNLETSAGHWPWQSHDILSQPLAPLGCSEAATNATLFDSLDWTSVSLGLLQASGFLH